jgi:hypothetical protein
MAGYPLSPEGRRKIEDCVYQLARKAADSMHRLDKGGMEKCLDTAKFIGNGSALDISILDCGADILDNPDFQEAIRDAQLALREYIKKHGRAGLMIKHCIAPRYRMMFEHLDEPRIDALKNARLAARTGNIGSMNEYLREAASYRPLTDCEKITPRIYLLFALRKRKQDEEAKRRSKAATSIIPTIIRPKTEKDCAASQGFTLVSLAASG